MKADLERDVYLSTFLYAQIWEPTIGRLLCSPACRVIDEIWVWEAVHHGDAGIINSAKASAVCKFVFHMEISLEFFLITYES